MTQITFLHILVDSILLLAMFYSAIVFPFLSPGLIFLSWFMGRYFGLKEGDKG